MKISHLSALQINFRVRTNTILTSTLRILFVAVTFPKYKPILSKYLTLNLTFSEFCLILTLLASFRRALSKKSLISLISRGILAVRLEDWDDYRQFRNFSLIFNVYILPIQRKRKKVSWLIEIRTKISLNMKYFYFNQV